MRPWLTVILDDHSRAVAGYTVFLGSPTAVQTALALRQAIWRKADPQWPVGSGTTLAVAGHLGRQAVGVELLADRVATARARIDDPSYVCQGNALDLDQLDLGTFQLCLTSPPYMNAVDHPENPLAGYQTLDGDYQRYVRQMGEVFTSIAGHLRPAGALVLSVANIRTGKTVTPLADDLVNAAMRSFTLRETIPLTWDQTPTWLIHDRLVVLDPIERG